MRKPLPFCAADLEAWREVVDDLTLFAERHLKIRTKDGPITPLVLNRAQRHVHQLLEAQKARTGKVRALILKARQQGFSTYVGARFYHQATSREGVQVFILTHEQAATDTLFGMVDRFHAENLSPLKPVTGKANARTLSFKGLQSGYSVGTAGKRAVGRSKTVQLFHGSEVAWWPNAASHFAGVVQGIPDLKGTEVILESTGNGVGGTFHERWQQAEAGVGDYQAIFVPWFWTEEYRRKVSDGFALSEDEQAYAAAHGLDMGQMAWRRAKIADLGDAALFKQEYPATADEAFQSSGHDGFITPEAVLKARKSNLEGLGPLVIGADPARFGDDRFCVAWRRGRKVLKVESKAKIDVVQGANWLRQVIDADRPARMFIDVGGLGAGVVDILRSWGPPYEPVVTGVNFGGEPMDPVQIMEDGSQRPGPRNRRAEMWKRSRDWLADVGGADVPDEDGLQADACAPEYSYDAHQRLLLESKEKMRSRGVRSPDGWDAVALTFAEPVRETPGWFQRKGPIRRRIGGIE